MKQIFTTPLRETHGKSDIKVPVWTQKTQEFLDSLNWSTLISAKGNQTTIVGRNGEPVNFGDSHSTHARWNIDTLQFANKHQTLNVLPKDYQSVAFGSKHALFLQANGSIKAFGHNQYGQLGVNITKTRLNIVELELDEPIVQVACGVHFSCLLTESGKVYVSGSNGCGELGLGDVKDRFDFEEVVLPEGTGRILSIAAGDAHSVLLTEHGRILTSGDNSKDQLGPGYPQELWDHEEGAYGVTFKDCGRGCLAKSILEGICVEEKMREALAWQKSTPKPDFSTFDEVRAGELSAMHKTLGSHNSTLARGASTMPSPYHMLTTITCWMTYQSELQQLQESLPEKRKPKVLLP